MEATAGPQAERSRRLAAQAMRAFPPALLTVSSSALATSAAMPTQTGERQAATSTSSPQTSIPNGLCPPTAACHVEITQLQDEKAFLKKFAERLLVQLRHVLQKHGELDKLKTISDAALCRDNGGEAGNDMDVTEKKLPPWMVSQEVVHPLLQAYDIKIYDLERAIDDCKQAADRMTLYAENLAQSNSALRQELESATERMVLHLQHETTETSMRGLNRGESVLNGSNGDYISELSERIDVLMSENTMLMEQVSLQDDEMTSVRKELVDRDQQILVMGQSFNQATVALQELRDAYSGIEDEKNRCEHQLQQYAIRIAELETEKDAGTKQFEVAKTAERILQNQLQDYEVLLENVKANAERKEESFAARYQHVSSRLRELSCVVEDRDKRVETLEEQIRTLTSELECVRQDCEGMLQVMNSMEKQLTQYCSREDAVVELEQHCKVKVEEVILEKEQISAREAQARREIARLLERLRSVTDTHVKEQEESIAHMTKRHDEEIKNRENEIRELSTELAQLRVKLELANRGQRDAEKNLDESTRRSRETVDVYERKVKSIIERTAIAEEAKELSARAESDAKAGLRAKDDELMKMRNDFRDRTHELNEQITPLTREVDVRRGEARELREETEEKTRKIQMLSDQLNKVKADCANRYSADFEAVHKENRELKSRAAELEYRLAQSKADLSNAVANVKSESERAEVRLTAEVEALKARVASLKEEKLRLERVRQESDSRQTVMALQIQQLTRDLVDSREALAEREQACDESDRKVSELSAQITIALSKQQQFFRQERDLRASIERFTLEKTRLERDATVYKKKLEDYRQADFLGMNQFSGCSDSSGISKSDKRSQLQSNQHQRFDETSSGF